MSDTPREYMRLYDMITVARSLAMALGKAIECEGHRARAYSDDVVSVVATEKLPVLIVRLRVPGTDSFTPAVLAVNDQDRIEQTYIMGIGEAFKHIMELTHPAPPDPQETA